MGCAGKRVDQLEPVETGGINSSTPDSTVGPNPGTQAAIVDDQLIVLDPSNGYRALLNASAALVFTAFTTDRRVGDVVAQLVDETGVAADDLVPDVLDTVDRLLVQGLLTRGGIGAASERVEPVSADTPDDVDDDPTIGRTWSFVSGVRAAAGVPVVVRVEPAALAVEIAEALGALSPAGTPPGDGAVVHLAIIAGPDGTTGGSGAAGTANSSVSPSDEEDEDTALIVVDGRVRSNRLPHAGAVASLFDLLDREVAGRAAGLRFHAGAVERDGNVVVIVGQSGHGKSTLTAALVQAGWRYLTDELVVVDATTFAVAPYARPLDLNQQSMDQLHIGSADLVTGARKDKVFPSRLGQLSAGGRVAAIIVLTGEPPEDGDLVTDLATPEAVMALLALTFAATFEDADALECLARLCSATLTVRLSRAPIDTMVGALEETLAAVVPGGASGTTVTE